MPSVEDVKAASRSLRGALSQELTDETPAFSADSGHLLKFHGIYQQDDRDVRRERTRSGHEPDHIFMVRASVPGGALSATQWLAIDRLADTVADGTFRLTSRGGIQLHFARKEGLAPLIRSLDEHLVTTLAACGDVVRNIVACPAPLADSRQKVLLDLAQRLAVRFRPRTRAYYEVWIDGEPALSAAEAEPATDLEPLYGTTYLPRKFKIGLAWPGDGCTDLFSHDLGLVPITGTDGADGFAVLVGGGLGATHARPDDTFPRLADLLGWVPAEAVEDLAEAVVLAYRDLGDREDRKRARLKYVLEDIGVAAFRREVEARLGARLAPAPALPPWQAHDHLGWHSQDDGRWFLGVPVPSGRVTGAWRAALAEVVERHRTDLRVTPRQDVLLTGIDDAERTAVEAVFRRHGVALAGDLAPVRRLAMACPALPTCGQALAEAERVAPDVLSVMEGELGRRGLSGLDLHVRMTGCPNGCARPYTAEIGIVGRSKTGYDVHLGGAPGGDRLARPAARGVKLADLPSVLGPWFDRFATEREPGESFGDFVHRTGSLA
ncbi:MAG TPA: NADPH-dependent assimilatory sulfite reductase hemoprotein subunit [Acidimicrobiales bacterium]|nr:NADPH-dependent assimilatory sulfite reductase hemoprotein subunit [Acidimicrobiales bacterium]